MSEDNLNRGAGVNSMGEIVHNARAKNNPTMHSGFMLNGAKSSVEHRKETVVRPAILTKNADLNFE